MKKKFNTIDPNQANIPETALIQKVTSENERLPNGEHEKAVKAFYVSDSIASGIGKDFAFVEQIPQFINEIIENKSWECLYVSKSVVTPYYCRYTKGTDSENFRAFIAAKRPNGLGTNIETIERLLEAEPEVKRKFRAIIYESHQGERTDLIEATSYGDRKKLEGELSQTQKSVIRAANRAAEAIPEVGELLDKGLIAIDVAAKLGRDIKDPNNLTAEEREYVDKRDLIGVRIKQYINTNTIPEDEDREPAYRRKLNDFVRDLLGIKERSKPVRMDDPKKAAKKILQFYQGEKLKELLEYLNKGLDSTSTDTTTKKTTQDNSDSDNALVIDEVTKIVPNSNHVNTVFNNKQPDLSATVTSGTTKEQTTSNTSEQTEIENEPNGAKRTSQVEQSNFTSEKQLTNVKSLSTLELARRLNLKTKTIINYLNRNPEKFKQWTKQKDPDGIAWQKSARKKGRSNIFEPIEQIEQEETT